MQANLLKMCSLCVDINDIKASVVMKYIVILTKNMPNKLFVFHKIQMFFPACDARKPSCFSLCCIPRNWLFIRHRL